MANFVYKNLRILKRINYNSIRMASYTPEIDFLHKHPTCKRVGAVPRAIYGGRQTATMLPGDGIGPEVMAYVEELFRVGSIPVDFEVVTIDPHCIDNDDVEYVVTSIKRNGVCLKGNIETHISTPGTYSRNIAIINKLDLFVNLVHCKSNPGITCRHKDIDILLIRQNTEGEYGMLEHESVPGVVECLKVVTAENTERLAKYAFEYAKNHGRKKVTTVHKANILKLSDGLFLKSAEKISKYYPDIEHDNIIIDNCCMQLVSNPHQFDVLLLPNLYGAVTSNVIAGLVGGPGLLCETNLGDHYAVFGPGTRHSGSIIAGKNLANPVAMLNASASMLEYLGYFDHASNIKKSLDLTINKDRVHTPDIGGTSSSTDMVNNIFKRFKKLSKGQNWLGRSG